MERSGRDTSQPLTVPVQLHDTTKDPVRWIDDDSTEINAVVPPVTATSLQIRPYLENCGYTGDRLAMGYQFANASVPLAGFSGKPWDARSACIAVADATVDSRSAAQNCLGLGAPTALICRGDSFDWWKLSFPFPSESRTIRATQIEGFFREHRTELAPDAIYGAKLRRPTGTPEQMWFVDIGLLPMLERRAGEALNRLVTQAIRTLTDDLGGKIQSLSDERGVYKTVFWLLAAKLLKEKRVKGFRSLDLTNVPGVFRIVGEHYRDARDYPPGNKTWMPALENVAKTVAGWGNLGNISTESLAYLYETALIDAPKKWRQRKTIKQREDVRKTLGIHSTPSILVDHMLSQLWPLVDCDKLGDQRVFEPACGHAAFLTAAMRDIRNWSGMEDSAARHRYLRERIRGIELDPFAVEIAKLSLTLADVPHGNTWEIAQGDMFRPGILREGAGWATMVLSNPPYEDFKKSKANRYEKTIEPVTAQTKAVEMLKRVVPNLADGAVFGFVLPQGTLYDRETKSLREELLTSCEIAEISLFEDKLFNADHETCILLGRRQSRKAAGRSVLYRRVRNKDMEAFKSSLAFSREDMLEGPELGRGEDIGLYEPDLREVWSYAEKYPRLGAAFTVSQGFQFFTEDLLRSRGLLSSSPKPGWLPVALRASDDYTIWEPPIAGHLNFGPKTYRARGGGAKPGIPQVILNYARLDRDSWRLQAVVDDQGIAVSSRFLVFRPLKPLTSRVVLWAVLNSPIGSAFFNSWSSKREFPPRDWLRMPFPTPTAKQKAEIEAAAAAYLTLAVPPCVFTLTTPDEAAIRKALLELDTAVLRLYELPPALERQLLAIFDGVERPGVGCTFRGYPPGWSSYPVKGPVALPNDNRPVWERIAEMAAALPDELLVGLPTDGASQLDHYLYGAPKKNQ